jgi:hypothetical protein
MVAYSKARMECNKSAGSNLQAIAKRIPWWQAVEIIGISDRYMRRWPIV